MEQSKPLVTVIIPHHLNENDKYLYWCLTSVLKSVNVPLEVICYSSAVYAPPVPDGVQLIHDPLKYGSCTKKFIAGIQAASPDSKYIAFVADDVMLTKHTLGELAETLGDNQMILGPASNCDATTRYHTRYFLGDQRRVCEIPQKGKLEDIFGFEWDLMEMPLERRLL